MPTKTEVLREEVVLKVEKDAVFISGHFICVCPKLDYLKEFFLISTNLLD